MEKHAARSRSSSSKHQNAYVAKNIISQDLFTLDYILNTIFRKDGPPLGVEFDSLPSGKLFHCKDPEILYSSCKESQRAAKKTKQSLLWTTRSTCIEFSHLFFLRKVVPKKNIAEITKRFNIQVNNLTQLSPVELLEET
ncbi:uncharacterized protein LOC133818052 [Humulus lupulus]|uniref:uncharacterized protein LOC133818052 n=1 Tax=Humulus lupulus TaxID=3486 RepID=UPI002B402760|nr:uncharacterized protein LOC133818052 [Humulus lupulus]